jgi:hypothetical protein
MKISRNPYIRNKNDISNVDFLARSSYPQLARIGAEPLLKSFLLPPHGI